MVGYITSNPSFISSKVLALVTDIKPPQYGTSHKNVRKQRKIPLVDINIIEGVFTSKQKQEMIKKVTDTIVSIEGENLREVTGVKINEGLSCAA